MFRCRAHEIIRGNTRRRKRERNLQRTSIYAPYVSSARNASAYSTYNARMRTLMSQGFAENGAVVARPSTPVAA